MKKEQKFKRGNLVHIAKDLGSMMSHFENDKDVIIVGSYAEQYGGNNTKSYTVMFPDTGEECSWYEEHQLTLIDEGGEHLFEEAKKNRERISEQNTDINYIVSKLDEGSLSSESILLLFDMLGHNTSFHRNGEFFVLFLDWQQLHPIFVHIKNAETLEEAQSVFTEKGQSKYNIKKVYEAFKGAVANAL
jgi:ribosomal protein S24E